MSSPTHALALRRRSGVLGTLPVTALALVAFAANSLLCREALRSGAIDPVSFTTVRLGAGALVLSLLVRARHRTADREAALGSVPALALLVYALGFSVAYAHLPAATGALLLFGAVQLTMVGMGVASGERPEARGWVGLLLAVAGLGLLLAPGLDAPPPVAAASMAAAGVAWGVYSLSGRRSRDPLGAAASSFRHAFPLAAGASLIMLPSARVSGEGLLLAAASGALASGLGYAVWYAVLPHLRATSAAAVQLLVPILAAAGGTILLEEPLTSRLIVASALTLAGIGLVLGSERVASPRRG
jgi:drug/metabolite transporter (DMT)-like permease